MDKEENEVRFCHVCKIETQQYLTPYDPDELENPIMIWYCTSCQNNIDFEK